MTDQDKDLERAKTMLQKAGHPETPEEEARTTAVIAARLAYRHGFHLVAGSGASGGVAAPFAEGAPTTLEDFIESAKKASLYRVIRSAYADRCKACGQMIVIGEQVAYVKDFGVTHLDRCVWYWNARADEI